jgi:hypothetical protein
MPAKLNPATLDDLDDPINSSDRAPLTGNITTSQANANTRAANNAQGYLNSAMGGEDRRAPLDTIDESVWDTLRRDLLAVWEKMRQVLYPKYLLGGMMSSGEGMTGRDAAAAEEGAAGALGRIRGVVGRWPDADTVLQGGMSEGLRDWDLWYVLQYCLWYSQVSTLIRVSTGVHSFSAYSWPSSSACRPGKTNGPLSSAACSPSSGSGRLLSRCRSSYWEVTCMLYLMVHLARLLLT